MSEERMTLYNEQRAARRSKARNHESKYSYLTWAENYKLNAAVDYYKDRTI